jgi:glutathione synthase/RimK-type ligase-like ATP-grasp enzyme
MSPRIALATAREVADLDPEGQQLADELRSQGATAEAAVWDATDVDWRAFDLVVVRSTWDYASRVAEFLAWAERVSEVTRIENSLPLLRWTTDKHYLRDLDRAGVPVVPSLFVEPGQDAAHDLLGAEHVAKPAVSAGSKDTLRLGPAEHDRSLEHVGALLAQGRSVLVQPYLSDVDDAGETALVFVDGVFSHAIRKGALLEQGAGLVDGLFAEEDIRARDASPAELSIGEAAMAALPSDGRPLYARVDLLPTPHGPVVLELELAEPSLFLDHAPGSAQRLAAAALRRVG